MKQPCKTEARKAEASKQTGLLRDIQKKVASIDETVTDILDELKDGSHGNGYSRWNSGGDIIPHDYDGE